MAKAALLACVFVDVFLHFVVKACHALLQLRQLIFFDVFTSLLVEIELLIIAGQLACCDSSIHHLLLRLSGTLSGQTMANRVNPFVQSFLWLI